MFIDVQAKHAVGMHWGSQPLTDEPVTAPVERLQEAVRRRGLAPDAFVAVEHGQVWTPSGVLPEAEAEAPSEGGAQGNDKGGCSVA